MKMKMKKEHFDRIKAAIEKLDPVTIQEHIKYLKSDSRVKSLDTRLRWDLFYAIGGSALAVKELVLYTYLDDTHIDSALKVIVKQLNINV